MKYYRLSSTCLPTKIPLNTVLWWLLAIKVYEMPAWVESLGWFFLGVILLVSFSLRLVEHRVDIFEKYRERKVEENEQT
jgi:hypothetical protein